MIEFHPEAVFVRLDGNDISVTSSLEQTFDDIVKVVIILTDNDA